MRPIHVSGHPCRDELTAMYDWVNPEIAIPVHGERRHLLEHAKLAKNLGIKHAYAPRNGEMIQIAPTGPQVVDIVASGRLHQDGNDIVSAHDEGLRLRRKMAYAGHISVGLVINGKGSLVAGPEPRISGFPEGKTGELIEDLLDDVAEVAEDTFDRITRRDRRDEEVVETKLASKIKRRVRERTGKRTIVEVIVHKVK